MAKRKGRKIRPSLGKPRPKTLNPRIDRDWSDMQGWFNSSRSEAPSWRPETRADCEHIPRPCPYLGCRHHLAQDLTGNGHIHLTFPWIFPWEMTHSCALDVAEDGQHTLEEVGEVLNVTRERVRQIERVAMAKCKGRLRPLFDRDGAVG